MNQLDAINKLKYRMQILSELGLTHDVKSRNFKGDAGKTDQDVVEYGTDELFDKHLKKLKP